MHYFSNTFSKIAKARFTFRYWWTEVTWFGQIVLFHSDYDEIELLKISYDVISVTSPQTITSQTTSPNQNSWLRQW